MDDLSTVDIFMNLWKDVFTAIRYNDMVATFTMTDDVVGGYQ